MAIMLKRHLSEGDKERIIEIHGRKCFATGHEIPEGEPVHFDHIKAFTTNGPTDLTNIAPMCGSHNKAKGTLPLEDFRIKLRMEKFFTQGDSLTLGNMLEFLKNEGDITSYCQPSFFREEDNKVTIDAVDNKYSYALYKCPITEWKYFYATLPVSLIGSDDEVDSSIGLQPRYLIFDKVFKLYRHFQIHPVLQPSIGRIVDNRMRLFDGQHKAAALLWAGRREIECKIYLICDPRLLNQTNIAAHDKFAQTRFYSSIMVLKLGTQFGVDFEEYKNLEDGENKTEAGFKKYLLSKDEGSLTEGDFNKKFRSFLYNSVLDNSDNKLSKYVSPSNRRTDEKPITIDMLSKSLFPFMYLEPINDNVATESYLRDHEVHNMIEISNMLYEMGLHYWNPNASSADSNQKKLKRIFGSKSMMAWSEILKDAICAKLDISDRDEKEQFLYRQFSPFQIEIIRSIVARLFNWSLWASPGPSSIDTVIAGSKGEIKKWFREKGLTTGYLMGAPE